MNDLFNNNALTQAKERATRLPLNEFDVSDAELFLTDSHWPYFERMRKEDPVHYCAESRYGPYWSLCNYKDIMAVDSNEKVFSSDRDITIFDQPDSFELPMFISKDQPEHHEQRKVVSPVVAPKNLAVLESTIRQRVIKILDDLPRGETFNWVQRVSIELTTQMLATLLDFPFEDRHKLTYWSDVATGGRTSGVVDSAEQRRKELMECLECFQKLWRDRADMAPNNDLISMLAHGKATQNMPPLEFLGNVVLLIVGGNDTTRNSITGGLLALNQFPDQYEKLMADPSLVTNMVPEIIRWQTPLPHMRRTALEDIEIGGKQIRKGDKVVMWYISGNRDESHFENADKLIIDRKNARSHLSFGYGIHRCMGNRLAEMQLRVLWEEIIPRFKVEVVAPPTRVRSNLIRGYSDLPVRIIPV
ncbi:MAG: cytochrome P450 [Pseudomonadales bacterium]|nr:cytochrome P450 [Pseudomonadales bacterium]